MRKLLGLLMAFLCFTGSLLAQKTITGKVTDDKGAPVPNASVVAKGTNSGTSTGPEGTFSLSVPTGAKTLVITSVGFAAKEIGIGAASFYEISLLSNVTESEEIVVTGYTNIKKTQFPGAATVLNAANTTQNRPVGSFNHLLQGKVPGMLVNSGTGQPGSNAQVTIRGVQSIQGAGAQPLYIIDGVPVSQNDFQSLNPNDFETLTVLKDANAAAMYGARAGVGVIVITTKQGRNGATQITARSQMGITLAPNFDRLNLMNTEELLAFEERIGLITGDNAFGAPGWVWSRKNPANSGLSEAALLELDRKLDSTRSIQNNLSDLLFRQGLSQTYEINVRGGNDKTQFFLSSSYFDQEGIDLTAGLKRYTTRFNIAHNLKNLRVQWNNMIGYSITNYAEGDQQGNSTRNPFQMIYRGKPYDNPYKADGSLNFGGSSNLATRTLANMLEGIQNSSYAHKQLKMNSGLTLTYNILDNLVLKNVFGVDVGWNQLERYINPGSYVGSLQQFNNGLATEGFGSSALFTNTVSLSYNTTLADKHDINGGVYFEAIRGYNKGLGFTLRNLNPLLLQTGQGAAAIPVPAGAATTVAQNASSARSGYGIRSYFASAGYSYDKRFSVNATIRRDGTSRIFNESNKEITTWSAGAIWNVIKENFMADQSVFSDLRVRFSYGSVPNIGSIGSSSYATGVWNVPNYAGDQVARYSTTNYPGASNIAAINPAAPGNKNYKIERIQKTNIGLDFAVWNNRARFTVDVYKNKTVDLFVNQPLSATAGFNALDINAGIMTNKGIEFMADVDVVKNRNFTVNVGFNHSINQNNIEDLGLVTEYFLGTFVIREGLPYGSHYNLHYLGADPGTGAPIYERPDGQPTTVKSEAGQFAKFGTYLPKHIGGFNFDVRWKRFSAQAFFSYQFDVVRSNNTRNWIIRGTTGYTVAVNQSRELIDQQWQKPGDQVFFNSPKFDRDFTSADLENAKFLRFRNLNIAYDVPGFNISGRSIIKGATVYANFHNLAVWSPWRGVDPEDNNNISLVEYPNPRMIVFGVDIKL